ncbi:hypothetical protein D3C79_963020 [compost metagenome]
MAAASVLSQRNALLPVCLAARGVPDRAARLSAVQPEYYPLVGEPYFCLYVAAPVLMYLRQLAAEWTLPL